MQHPDSVESSRPGTEERAPGLSPVRAFLLLATVATLIPLGIFATRDEAAPAESPGAARSPDYSLTNAEAIAEFERLNAARIRAYKLRDVALLDVVLAADSPLITRGHDEISRLHRNNVLVRSRFVTQRIEVQSRTSETVVVRQTELDYPRFLSEEGQNVTEGATPQKRVIEWTLRREGADWKLFDSRLISKARLQ